MDLLTFVNRTPNAIGYALINQSLKSLPQVSVIAINGAAPAPGNVRNGSYGYWTVEHLYAGAKPATLAKDFPEFLPGYREKHSPPGFITCSAALTGLEADC